MISIIVSSYNDKYLNQFKNSIKETIGVPYEIICIKNPGLMGICEAYNTGGAKAKFPYLCFSHEDIIFHTQNWGINLINHFVNNEKLGLLGVAGNVYKPYVLSGWGSSWGGNLAKISFNQVSGEIELPVISEKIISKQPDQVVALDGCFLCTKNSIFSLIKFDQNTFKDYHCYDIDYSLSIGKSYQLEVVYDIFFTHFSLGSYSKKWLVETIKLHKKWNYLLPVSTSKISKTELRNQEIGAFYFALDRVLQFNYGYKNILQINFSKKFLKLVGFSNWLWIQIKSPKTIIRFLKVKTKS